MPDPKIREAPSPFVERLDAAVERWARVLPAEMRREFRQELAAFGVEHDRTINTIENIWKRRERRYAFDESTGLARRRPFQEHLTAVLSTPVSSASAAIAVLFIDLDNLKTINDTYGHEAGDRALAAVGNIIRDAIRVDRRTDFVARSSGDEDDYSVSRHGGDEFLVALELEDSAGVDIVAPRIKRHADDPERQQARGYTAPQPLTVSIGGVLYERTAVPPPQVVSITKALVAAADEQMYESKRDGRIHLVRARYTTRLEIDRRRARVIG